MSNNFADTAQDNSRSSPGDTNSISQRLFSLDVIRGIALLGILLISIWEFGGFSTNEQTRLRLLGKGLDYYVVFSAWIFQLIFSAIWLKYFRFGPSEWLWRSLTYWQVQPMKR